MNICLPDQGKPGTEQAPLTHQDSASFLIGACSVPVEESEAPQLSSMPKRKLAAQILVFRIEQGRTVKSRRDHITENFDFYPTIFLDQFER